MPLRDSTWTREGDGRRTRSGGGKSPEVFPIAAFMAVLILAGQSVAFGAELTTKGGAKFRTESHRGAGINPDRGFSVFRVRPSFHFSGAESFDVTLEPQFAGALGMTRSDGTRLSGGTSDPAFLVHQAFVDYRPFEGVSLKIGRQELVYGDELLVGPLGWNIVSRSFDAGRLRYSHSLGFSDLFASKLHESNAFAAGSEDAGFYGFYNSVNAGEALREFDLYAFYRTDGAEAPSLRSWTAGLRLKSDVGILDYRAEVAGQAGRSAGAGRGGYQADVEIGAGIASLRLVGEGFVASRNFDQLFPTAHKWLGYVDVFGRRNIAGGRLGLSGRPAPKLTIEGSVHYFARADASAPAYSLDGVTPISSDSSSRSLGVEADLVATMKLEGGVTLSGGGGLLFPGAYLRSLSGEGFPMFGYVQMDFAY